jgi:hypothetical protein
MKTRITTFFAALMLISIVSFANDEITPSEKLQKEFSREFAEATNVKWEKLGDYHKASFVEDSQYFVAYFDAFNKLESLSRIINTSMLPLILQKDLKDKISESAWVADCFEMLREGGTEYYVVVESAEEKTIYQADNLGWNVFKRTDN